MTSQAKAMDTNQILSKLILLFEILLNLFPGCQFHSEWYSRPLYAPTPGQQTSNDHNNKHTIVIDLDNYNKDTVNINIKIDKNAIVQGSKIREGKICSHCTILPLMMSHYTCYSSMP